MMQPSALKAQKTATVSGEYTYVITEIHWGTLNQEAKTVEVVKTCSVCDESAERDARGHQGGIRRDGNL